MNCKPQNRETMNSLRTRPQGTLITPFDELVHGFFGRDISHFMGSDDIQRTSPRVNITERADGYRLDLLAPGVSKENLKLNVEDNTLTISATKKEETLAENERYTRREFTHHAFKRSFRLPENTEADRISASFNDGILTVEIPRVAPSKPATVDIAIK